ncbi:arginine transporter [Aestuariibius sp. 2305UL40-4]|uniref:arginine transporter n=1 Tax=Aestuariibius violaceus TaxID=3234132 RepID=UPI00345E80B8
MRSSLIALTILLTLAACGGSRVSGNIGQACATSDRRAANPELCRCVQSAADRSLSRSEQRRAAEFFTNPQLAQDTRQSDNPRDEEFWQRYRQFLDTAEASCRSYA